MQIRPESAAVPATRLLTRLPGEVWFFRTTLPHLLARGKGKQPAWGARLTTFPTSGNPDQAGASNFIVRATTGEPEGGGGEQGKKGVNRRSQNCIPYRK